MGCKSKSYASSKCSALMPSMPAAYMSAEAFECSLYFLCLNIGIDPLSMMHCVDVLVIFNDGTLLMGAVYGGSKQDLKCICQLFYRNVYACGFLDTIGLPEGSWV